jgi:formylglycine-generating enzyme required for sulfatase activity
MFLFNVRHLFLPLTAILYIWVVPTFQSINSNTNASVPPRKFRLSDTGQIGNYTQTLGEDSDYSINPPLFVDNGDGTITDSITGLMWQKTDGGEMTIENTISYCMTLSLAGHNDWRLPTNHELFAILNHSKFNPALDTTYFTITQAEYWWSADKQINDTIKIWVTNSGGGVGPHPRNETISAGGTHRFHVRAVRDINSRIVGDQHFYDNQDGTITDKFTGLTWQKAINSDTMTWETALTYAENLSLAGYTDWRLPNIKELQSISDERLYQPSLDTNYFEPGTRRLFWSSSTLLGNTARSWTADFSLGIVSYNDKVRQVSAICVRGVSTSPNLAPALIFLHGGDYAMGDHYGFIDPQHPSDEIPIHTVHVDSLYIGLYEVTNQQYCDFLNSATNQNSIEVRNGIVYKSDDTITYCFMHTFADYSSIGWDEERFAVIDNRDNHPMVGVMWFGAIAYCNWLSIQQGYQPCYDLATGVYDFSRDGYRLPTEAEWEYAGRGGQYNPYYNFPWGDDSLTQTLANWPSSGDPYETGTYPYTTPIGFYSGQRHYKYEYGWPGAQNYYQTSNGSNAFGLFDVAGNVWEFINDWYGNNYYSLSPYNNPLGPSLGTIMPNGLPYRGMRGGNWYNGLYGHSRVSNRNPSYYRGPQDPNHPWYHVGFRVARNGFELIGPQPCPYIPGDINGDGQRIGSDVTFGVRYFKGTGMVPPDSCFMDSTSAYLYVAGDVNGNCEFRGSDITRLVAYFKSTANISYCHFFPITPPRLLNRQKPIPVSGE